MSRADDVAEWSFLVGLILIAIAAVGGGGAALYKVVTADGKPDYCFTETITDVPGAVLFAHRPWRMNAPIAVVRDVEEAVRAASVYGCPLHR